MNVIVIQNLIYINVNLIYFSYSSLVYSIKRFVKYTSIQVGLEFEFKSIL